MNIPAVKCLEGFAFESNDDDIMSFYEIICIAKKYGGSMTVVIKMAIDKISRRIETEYEMMTIIARKKKQIYSDGTYSRVYYFVHACKLT